MLSGKHIPATHLQTNLEERERKQEQLTQMPTHPQPAEAKRRCNSNCSDGNPLEREPGARMTTQPAIWQRKPGQLGIRGLRKEKVLHTVTGIIGCPGPPPSGGEGTEQSEVKV